MHVLCDHVWYVVNLESHRGFWCPTLLWSLWHQTSFGGVSCTKFLYISLNVWFRLVLKVQISLLLTLKDRCLSNISKLISGSSCLCGPVRVWTSQTVKNVLLNLENDAYYSVGNLLSSNLLSKTTNFEAQNLYFCLLFCTDVKICLSK